MILNEPEIFKDFLLNSAVEEALNILLGPYTSTGEFNAAESNIQICSWKNENGYWTNQKERLENSRHFFMKMAVIAWDFLNISNVFQKL